MSKPTTRVLAVLELLQAHGRLSGSELARRLDIDPRTLRRYIAALEEIGVPVTAERGRYGGYALMAGFKLPPMMFTEDEALALAVGLLAARNLGLSEAAPATASAQAKLERIMPATLGRRVRAVRETTRLGIVRAGTAAAGPADNAALAALSDAALAQRRVRLRYLDADGARTERDLDPYGLALRDGRWYVAGLCRLRGALRTFRLDRIEGVEPLPASFLRPPDFDALAHLQDSIAALPRAHTVEVLLRTDLRTACAQFGETIGVFVPCPDGVLLRTRTDHIDWLARQLACLPCAFEIREPDALRAALARHAAGLLAMAQAGPT